MSWDGLSGTPGAVCGDLRQATHMSPNGRAGPRRSEVAAPSMIPRKTGDRVKINQRVCRQTAFLQPSHARRQGPATWPGRLRDADTERSFHCPTRYTLEGQIRRAKIAGFLFQRPETIRRPSRNRSCGKPSPAKRPGCAGESRGSGRSRIRWRQFMAGPSEAQLGRCDWPSVSSMISEKGSESEPATLILATR
jgi:hypothetical protein